MCDNLLGLLVVLDAVYTDVKKSKMQSSMQMERARVKVTERRYRSSGRLSTVVSSLALELMLPWSGQSRPECFDAIEPPVNHWTCLGEFLELCNRQALTGPTLGQLQTFAPLFDGNVDCSDGKKLDGPGQPRRTGEEGVLCKYTIELLNVML